MKRLIQGYNKAVSNCLQIADNQDGKEIINVA